VVKRVISTILLWSLIAAIIHFLGVQGAVWLCAVLAALAQNELYTMLEKIGQRPFRWLGITFGALIILGPFYMNEFVSEDLGEGIQSGLLAVGVVACCLRVMRERRGAGRIETLIATVFGMVYVPFMMFFIVRIMWMGSTETSGMMLAVWLLFAAKFCDVAALVVGSLIGRHKIAPSMSPAKTWEGAVGGVIIASALSAVIVALYPQHYPASFTPLVAGFAALPVASVSIVSDLIESVLKRMSDIKDSGRTVPGIGGAFDLVDSLILAAPVGFLVLRVIV
jgi:phosphatidate cytidylyltransferase